jgi:hypothetical protein
MEAKAEFVLGANFGTPYGSGSQLIFSPLLVFAYPKQRATVSVGSVFK